MTQNKIINFKNLFLFIKRYLFLNKNTLAVAFGAVSGTIFLILMFAAYQTKSLNSDILFSTVMPFFFLGGLIFTSSSFKELHDPKTSYSFLTFPISTFEKLSGIWLSTSVLFSIVSIVIIYIINILASVLFSQLFNFQLHIDNIFTLQLFSEVGKYIVIQSIFLLGAIYFRKNNFLKTILAISVIFIVFAILTGLAGRIMFNDFIIPHNFNFNSNGVSIEHQSMFSNTIPQILNFTFWYLLTPFFLIVSYFRLKERQI
ncbi:MAG: hypothetical protein KAG95_06945 [Bacteroidales bacterium]|nr:hypothetical protein [Bacteroidales bacterium]